MSISLNVLIKLIIPAIRLTWKGESSFTIKAKVLSIRDIGGR